MNEETKKQRVKVQFTETYTYDLEFEISENETISDVIQKTPLLINKDADWIKSNRDDIHVESSFNFEIK